MQALKLLFPSSGFFEIFPVRPDPDGNGKEMKTTMYLNRIGTTRDYPETLNPN